MMARESALAAELNAILNGVRVLSPTTFAFGETEVERPPDELLSSLQDLLYAYCYTRRFSGSPSDNSSESADISGHLRQSHVGRACRDCGWNIEQVIDRGAVLARKGDGIRLFAAGHFLLLDGFSETVEKGQRLLICHPKDSVTRQPGYYHVWGETLGEYSNDHNFLRFYWNIDSEGAPSLVNLITRKLNRFQIPFQAKFPRFRELYHRRDAAVLYVCKWYYRIAAQLVQEIHEEIRQHLDGETPLFTKRLETGLGFAEDPGNFESFGTDRCGVLADAMWDAYQRNQVTAAERLQTLDAAFEARGLNLAQPYLNAGSRDEYEFPVMS
jgi:hypothetical protein